MDAGDLGAAAQQPLPTAAISSSVTSRSRALAVADRDAALELGMANALVSRLSRRDEIVVRPTSAILKYAAADDPIAAGREQAVDAVIDAKLQRSAGRLRVVVELLRVADARLLWAETFDESADDVFALQDAIAARVAAALPIASSPLEQSRETSSMAAYEAFLKGSYHAMTFAPGGFEKAVEHLTRAIELDPRYARAYGALAFAYSALPTTGPCRPACRWSRRSRTRPARSRLTSACSKRTWHCRTSTSTTGGMRRKQSVNAGASSSSRPSPRSVITSSDGISA